MTTKILEIGYEPTGGIAVNPELEFEGIPDKEIITCDIDADNNPDIIQDIREPFPEEHHGTFDIILCSHVLEHIEYNKVVFAMHHMTQCLNMGGEIMLVVPSLEWACRRVLDGNMDPATYAVLWGAQGDPHDYHKAGFTLECLRNIGGEFGLHEILAETGNFYVLHEVVYTDGTEEKYTIPCEQNIYIGRKVKEVETAKEEVEV